MTDGMVGGNTGKMEIPEIQGALVGFRVWSVRGNKLVSTHKTSNSWEPGVNQAQCKGISHPKRKEWENKHWAPGIIGGIMGWNMMTSTLVQVAEAIPHNNCHCGLYAYRRVETGFKRQHGNQVVGAVLMWGRIEVHQTGMRAEYALPILLGAEQTVAPQGFLSRLTQSEPRWADTVAVARRYAMSIVPPDELEARATQCGKLY